MITAERTSGGLESTPGASDRSGLSERDAAILEFERTWFRCAAPKDVEIKERFGMSTARYFQTLNALIDTPEALAHDPLLVKRLRRLRDARHRSRSASRLKA